MYIDLLRGILTGGDISPGYGKNGFYLAASGSVVWDDLYKAMALSLKKRGVIEDGSVTRADTVTLAKMGTGLNGVPAGFVPVCVEGL